MDRKYKIKVFNNISKEGLKLFSSAKYELGDDYDNPDAILLRSKEMSTKDFGKNIKAVGRAGVGVNNIPVDYLSTKGLAVFNTPGANANAVCELVLSSLFLTARNLIRAIKYTDELVSNNNFDLIEEVKKKFAGFELRGKKIGIVGLGKIGSLVAENCLKLGMNVYGYDPNISVDLAWKLSSSIKKCKNLEEIMKESDFLSFHVPLTKKTTNLINKSNISIIKKNAIILNFSRDKIINSEALLCHLDSNNLKYYICDFPNEKIFSNDKVICLPHLGASTFEAERNCAQMIVTQITNFLENGNVQNSVNFPDLSMKRESKFRLAIVNSNVPNMVGQLSTVLANHKLNIHNLINKSKGNIAYNLFDIDSKISNKVILQMKSIKGILSVRYLPVRDF